MKKKKRKNRVILAICSMFIAVMSIFAFIPFNNDKQVVKADSISGQYTFNSSELMFPAYIYSVGGDTYNYYGTQFPKFKFSVETWQNNEIITTLQTVFVYNTFGLGNYTEYRNDNDINDFNLNLTKNNTYVRYQPKYGSYYQNGVEHKFYSNMYFLCNSSSFNGNIVSIQIGSYLYNPLNDFSIDPYYNYAKYIDDNNNYITMVVPFDANPDDPYHINNPEYFAYDFRTYFLNIVYSDNQYYLSGYDKGYNNGLSAGVSTGYNDGYNVGKNDGYWLGYDAGSNSDGYSFDSLLSAVIDVPVRTFTSLFNFNILGVNLSGFFLGLLTCCIVITVIRLVL